MSDQKPNQRTMEENCYSGGDYYNNRAKCDTSMKLGRDGQFDTLKKMGCGHKLKDAPLCYF